MKYRTKVTCSVLPDEYSALVALFPPRPIRDDIDAQNVEEIVTVMAGHRLNADQEDYLEVLSELLLKYQRQRFPARYERRSAAQRLRYLLEQSSTSPTQLSKILGCSQSLVSLVLNGRRALSKHNIKKLADHFRLDAGYFM